MKVNEIIAYYTTSGDNLVTALYLQGNFVEALSSGFGQGDFGLLGFGE